MQNTFESVLIGNGRKRGPQEGPSRTLQCILQFFLRSIVDNFASFSICMNNKESEKVNRRWSKEFCRRGCEEKMRKVLNVFFQWIFLPIFRSLYRSVNWMYYKSDARRNDEKSVNVFFDRCLQRLKVSPFWIEFIYVFWVFIPLFSFSYLFLILNL